MTQEQFNEMYVQWFMNQLFIIGVLTIVLLIIAAIISIIVLILKLCKNNPKKYIPCAIIALTSSILSIYLMIHQELLTNTVEVARNNHVLAYIIMSFGTMTEIIAVFAVMKLAKGIMNWR